MKPAIKYLVILMASLGVLFAAALLIIPSLVKIEQYKPKLEELVSQKTGYPLQLSGPIDVSLFPWVGVNLSEVTIGNPSGFENPSFVSVQNFQAHLKVLPLLSKTIEIDRVVLDQPAIVLERTPTGQWNFQQQKPDQTEQSQAGPVETTEPSTQPTPETGGQQTAFGFSEISAGEFTINNGSILIDDRQAGTKRLVSDFNLQLIDISLVTPVSLVFSANVDGQALRADGTFGPIGPEPGRGDLPFALNLQGPDGLALTTSGRLSELIDDMRYAATVALSELNPRQLAATLGHDFPVQTQDPQALTKLAMQAELNGSLSQVTIENSQITMDDTMVELTAELANFREPDIRLAVAIDTIDLDRYLPPAESQEASKEQLPSTSSKQQSTSADSGTTKPEEVEGHTASSEAEEQQQGSTGQPSADENRRVDYTPLRTLRLDTSLSIKALRVQGGTIEDIAITLTGENGLFTLEQFGAALYQGTLSTTGTVDVRKDKPVSAFEAVIADVQVGPLLRDFAKKDVIEGRLLGDMALTLTGDQPEEIKQSLNGTANLSFFDGALIGIDLAELARNIKSGFTLEQQSEKPKTDFAELIAPITITDGLVETAQTSLKSPFIRMQASGSANLVSQALDLRVTPKLVGTIKGQGDQEERSGLAIPILVSGTMQKPKFAPDLEALVSDQLPDEQELTEIIKSGEIPAERKEQVSEEIEKAKDLLKGLFGN